MEDLTLKWISDNVAFIVTFAGGLTGIYLFIKKAFTVGLKPIEEKITKIDTKITNVETSLKEQIKVTDLNSTKNFLVARLEDIKNGQDLDSISLERFWEEYEHYKEDLKGNSYIENEVKKLQKDGKL